MHDELAGLGRGGGKAVRQASSMRRADKHGRKMERLTVPRDRSSHTIMYRSHPPRG
eukprot:SAG22_NODE_1438_length_4419_cov_1.685880_1_plen_56_part_00